MVQYFTPSTTNSTGSITLTGNTGYTVNFGTTITYIGLLTIRAVPEDPAIKMTRIAWNIFFRSAFTFRSESLGPIEKSNGELVRKEDGTLLLNYEHYIRGVRDVYLDAKICKLIVSFLKPKSAVPRLQVG